MGISRLGASGSEFLISFNLDVGSGCRHQKAGLELQDPLPTWRTHMAIGRKAWFFVGCWQEASVPHCVDLSIRCLSVLMAAGFPRGGDPRKSKAETAMSFMTKPVELTY